MKDCKYVSVFYKYLTKRLKEKIFIYRADYAFAVATVIETCDAIKNKRNVRSYSAQQLLDCTTNAYCFGGSALQG